MKRVWIALALLLALGYTLVKLDIFWHERQAADQSSPPSEPTP